MHDYGDLEVRVTTSALVGAGYSITNGSENDALCSTCSGARLFRFVFGSCHTVMLGYRS